jgi:DNA-binding LacI/PurR family transcriptional regulator
MAFPALTLDFFREHSFGDPFEAFGHWQAFADQCRRPAEETQYRKCLELALGVSEGEVRNWLSKDATRAVSWGKAFLFHDVTRALHERGYDHPLPRLLAEERVASKRPARATRIALFTRWEIVSQTFFLETVRGIADACAGSNLSFSIHPMPDVDQPRTLERELARFEPDGVLMLRVTPEAATVDRLALHRVPLVLIHADRYAYPQPVLGNVVPDLSGLDQELIRWLKQGCGSLLPRERKAVLLAMPDEPEGRIFPRKPGLCPSLRNERKQRLWRALEAFPGKKVKLDRLPDYGFRHAAPAWREHRDADLWVCLSDALAVGIKHLMLAAGEENWHGRVIGFDNSTLAQEEHIDSFGQELRSAGAKAVDALRAGLARQRAGEARWPDFREISNPVRLSENALGAGG